MTDPFPDSRPLAELLNVAPEWPALPSGWAFTSLSDPVTLTFSHWVKHENPCRVYWGSHGCDLERGHEGDCDCGCCECENHPDAGGGVLCVAKAPYYGPETRFYGEDVAARGLPAVN
jgi:hypothetical protein